MHLLYMMIFVNILLITRPNQSYFIAVDGCHLLHNNNNNILSLLIPYGSSWRVPDLL